MDKKGRYCIVAMRSAAVPEYCTRNTTLPWIGTENKDSDQALQQLFTVWLVAAAMVASSYSMHFLCWWMSHQTPSIVQFLPKLFAH